MTYLEQQLLQTDLAQELIQAYLDEDHLPSRCLEKLV